MSMNPKVKATWVAALRSGEYQQGREQLKCDAEFCCLGVLCDLYAKEHGVAFDFGLYGGGGDDELPSSLVLEWAGLDSEDPQVEIDGARQNVSVHNDGAGTRSKTFAQIADAIEGQL
uniref:Uncharacterized protein n=1 Tax=Variovorax paradoxus (strain S110) TaxID=543728 RepID=C5CJL3_VARPS